MTTSSVLMYHAVTDAVADDIPSVELPYTVSIDSFRRQMCYLSETGAAPQSILAAGRHPHHSPSTVITFDDGHATDFVNALPHLLEYGFQAEFYITTGWIGKPRYMNKSQLRELASSGMHIGTHGVTHRYFDELTEAELEHELRESKATLEDILGIEIYGGSVPGGRLHPRTGHIAAAMGYKYLCTSRVGVITSTSEDQFRFLPRLVVNRATSMQDFPDLVAARNSTLLLRRLRAFALDSAKTVLGNRLYDRLRARLLPGN